MIGVRLDVKPDAAVYGHTFWPAPESNCSPVFLSVGGPQFEVDPEVEDDEGGEGDDAGDDELVPPRAEGDVVLILVQLGRPIVGVVRLGVGAQLELEEARHRQSSCNVNFSQGIWIQ